MAAPLWLVFGFWIPLSILAVSTPDFSIIDYDYFGRDYTPLPPPSLPPLPPFSSSVSCEDDLKGIGSLNDSCQINTSLQLKNDLYIKGTGSLDILPGVVVSCAISGCSIAVNMSGDFNLGQNSSVVAGEFVLIAANVTLQDGSLINVTGLAGAPPAQTSGSPLGIDGAGGGHGGRGASCLRDKEKLQEDVWGGDTYAWSTLTLPWSYGSKGGTTSREEERGGGGGGRIGIEVKNLIEVNGTVSADGGDGGLKGGGGSGGSIYIKAQKM